MLGLVKATALPVELTSLDVIEPWNAILLAGRNINLATVDVNHITDHGSYKY